MNRIHEWLRGDAASCLVLVPEQLPGGDGFLTAVGLEGSRVQRLAAGEVRPSFEPHATVVEALGRGDVTDIVVVTCTSLRRFRRRRGEQAVASFLDAQLDRLERYRTIPGLSLSDVQLHGWLWDCERGRLTPYSHETGELQRARSVTLTLDNAAPLRLDVAS